LILSTKAILGAALASFFASATISTAIFSLQRSPASPLPAATPPVLSIVAPAPVVRTDPLYPSAPAAAVSAFSYSFKKGTTPPAGNLDVSVKSGVRAPVAWMLSNCPAWLSPPSISIGGKPSLGNEFLHPLAAGQTKTYRFAILPAVAATYPIGTFRDEIAIFAPGYSDGEIRVECSLVVTR